jgi:uncharacterized protein
MNDPRRMWRVLVCAAAGSLSACHSATTRIYELDAISPAARMESYQAPALRIDAVSVPPNWDRIEIVTPLVTGDLKISDFDHWAAPLAQLTRQALSDDIERRLPPGSLIYPRLPKPSNALGVSVDILQFTVSGSHASMQASWLIAPIGVLSGGKRASALLQTSIESAEPAAVAHAWSRLVGLLADHICVEAGSFNSP